MRAEPRRPLGPAAAASALAVLPLFLGGPLFLGAPAVAAEPAPAAGELVSGTEAAKAALVRIEVSATAHIAHVDASSGEAVVARGRYEVPIRSGTGVFTSSDGVIATAGSTLLVTEDQVVVHAANQLFQDQIGTELVGNDGDLSVRARAADPYWAPHLQHCYDQVTHCILFFVEKYEVLPWTGGTTSTPADLVRAPAGVDDVGLLRISGGGGTPTAELADPDAAAPDEALLVGFTERPSPDLTVPTTTVGIDRATGALTPAGELAERLGAGMSGAPLLDPATGAVSGLVTTADGRGGLVPVRAVHEALEAAGTPPASSAFDVVFRRGIDHLASGTSSGSAAAAFEEALAYYDSALAAQHLRTAQATGGAGGQARGTTATEPGGGVGGIVLRTALGVLATALLLVLVLVLRRRRATGRRSDAAAPDRRAPPPVPAAGSAAGPRRGSHQRPESHQRPASAAASAVPVRAPAHSASAPPQRAPSPASDRTRLRDVPAGMREPAPAARPPASCAHCGGSLRDGARYCGRCGSPVG